MADYASRDVNVSFKGLTTTVAIFGVVGSICLIGFETLRQLRRLPKVGFVPFWKHDRAQRQGGKGGVDGDKDEEGAGGGIGVRSKLTCEDWEMGHLYLARMFHATTPTPAMARWPLAWTWQALKFDEWFYATHTGMDTVVYVRFLRALVWYLTLQTCTTAPILLTIHFKFSTGASLTDMTRASLSYLVTIQSGDCEKSSDSTCQHQPNEQGRRLLWIHLCLLWYISITWCYALWWIGSGSLRVRRRLIDEIRQKRSKAVAEAAATASAGQKKLSSDAAAMPLGEAGETMAQAHGLPHVTGAFAGVRGDDSDGWRQRTLLVTNLPPTMRDEASIRRYFEEFLRPDEGTPMSSIDNLNDTVRTDDGRIQELQEGQEQAERPTKLQIDSNVTNDHSGMVSSSDTNVDATSPLSPVKTSTDALFGSEQPTQSDNTQQVTNDGGPQPDFNPERHLRSPVQTVVLVRKMNELSSMLSRRQEVLNQLEAAHIKLAQNVLTKVGRQTTKMRKDEAKKRGFSGGMNGVGMGKLDVKLSRISGRKGNKKAATKGEEGEAGDVEKDAAMQLSEERLRLNDLAHRLARFSPSNKGHHQRDAQMRGISADVDDANVMAETVWEALSEVPRDLLDSFQPVTRLSSLFRGQTVPTIDYLLTKLNLLTALVTEMRARPPSSYEGTSTAFVTFRDPRQARMVWRELKSQIVVKVRLAPEVKDLDWERLMRTSFTGDLVRGLGVNSFFWAFTIFWVVPVGFLSTSLFSVSNIKELVPGLSKFLDNNRTFEGFLSVTLPTVIVALLTMAVPELIFQISKRAQGFLTFSALYDQCLCRYWKFVICNVVIFFCVGTTTVSSILNNIGNDPQILDNIAFSFPTAAPFYVSYLILGMGLHTGFELFGFMVPLIQHLGARKAITPRARAVKTLPRNFNRYYWLPFHVLILSIVFLFALLNPLVIPFGLVYIWVAMIVFKKNFAYTYFRRFNEKEGVVYFTRIVRFSLDGLLVAQIVILIFFSVTKQEAVYIALTAILIPLTISLKLLATRLWKSQCRAVEDDEANALCGIMAPSTSSSMIKARQEYGDAEYMDETFDSRSPLDARASGRYPTVLPPPETSSAIIRVWHRISNTFNANGNDRPSYIASAQARGSRLSAKTVTGAVAQAPVQLIEKTAKTSKQYGVAAKSHLRRDPAVKELNREEESHDLAKEAATETKLGNNVEQMAASGAKEARKASQKKASKYRTAGGSSLNRGMSKRSARSDEAPFLSGFEAIANHAPVASSEDGDSIIYGDGEGDELLNNTRIAHSRGRSHHKRESTHPSYSTSRVKSRPNAEQLAEFGMISHLSTPHEGDESPEESNTRQEGSNHEEEDDDDDEEEEEELEDEEDDIKGRWLVRPHAKVRWDDTPNNHARYNNPFYSREMEDFFLWLPRDPLAPLDLCDTIEWHGSALVSSQGGRGQVGEWEEEEEQVGKDDAKDGQSADGEGSDDGSERSARLSEIGGNEEIAIFGPLAARLQEAEDAEEVIDPAASLPRNVMDDYKKAIGDRGGSQSQLSPSPGQGLSREHSFLSGLTRRSSTAAPRRRSVTSETSERPNFLADIHRKPSHQNSPARREGDDTGKITSPSSAEHQMVASPSSLSTDPKSAPSIAEVAGTGAPESPTRGRKERLDVLDESGELTAQAEEAPAKAVRQTSAGSVVSPAGISFKPTNEPEGAHEHHNRRDLSLAPHGRGVSHATSAGSVLSGRSAGGHRTVTMRKALQAEVLEEERRRTIKQRLTIKGRLQKHAKKGKSEVELDGDDFGPSTRGPDEESSVGYANDTIMGRHERAILRRQMAMSEGFGTTVRSMEPSSSAASNMAAMARSNTMRDLAQTSPSKSRKKLAVVPGSSKGKGQDAEGGAGVDVPMMELPPRKATNETTTTAVTSTSEPATNNEQ